MLRLKEIGKQFENGRVALREISLEISPTDDCQRSGRERIWKEYTSSACQRIGDADDRRLDLE